VASRVCLSGSEHGKFFRMVSGEHSFFSASSAASDATAAPPAADAPESGTVSGKAVLQPPVAYLPCRVDDAGNLDEVLMVELNDGRIALMGYTALDRFLAACGDGHPWVLWRTDELEALRDLKPFDVAYLDVPLPVGMRVRSDPADRATAHVDDGTRS
jgi:hypothetical protein